MGGAGNPTVLAATHPQALKGCGALEESRPRWSGGAQTGLWSGACVPPAELLLPGVPPASAAMGTGAHLKQAIRQSTAQINEVRSTPQNRCWYWRTTVSMDSHAQNLKSRHQWLGFRRVVHQQTATYLLLCPDEELWQVGAAACGLQGPHHQVHPTWGPRAQLVYSLYSHLKTLLVLW
jgi:hypothetical protein